MRLFARLRALAWILILALSLQAETGARAQVLHTGGILTHISVYKDMIFAGNAEGGIDIFSLSSHKARKLLTLKLPPIQDYFGNTHLPRVYDIATFDGETLFILSEGSQGTRQILSLHIHNPRKIHTLLQTNAAPKRIIAYGGNKLVVGFLSNEIGLFDLQSKAFVYKTHLSPAGFSDMCVNAPYIFSTDESGSVNVLDIASGALLKRLDTINKDNNYQIASARDTILTAGVDKQMAIYTFATDSHHTFTLRNATSIKSGFLIYAVGISPSGTLAAYSKNEQSDIGIIHLPTQRELLTLKGNSALANALIFYDERTLIVGSDERYFTIWHIKE